MWRGIVVDRIKQTRHTYLTQLGLGGAMERRRTQRMTGRSRDASVTKTRNSHSPRRSQLEKQPGTVRRVVLGPSRNLLSRFEMAYPTFILVDERVYQRKNHPPFSIQVTYSRNLKQ